VTYGRVGHGGLESDLVAFSGASRRTKENGHGSLDGRVQQATQGSLLAHACDCTLRGAAACIPHACKRLRLAGAAACLPSSRVDGSAASRSHEDGFCAAGGQLWRAAAEACWLARGAVLHHAWCAETADALDATIGHFPPVRVMGSLLMHWVAPRCTVWCSVVRRSAGADSAGLMPFVVPRWRCEHACMLRLCASIA
jgi:hypothetical protein